MSKKSNKNTKKGGLLRFLFFQEKRTFVGVCLDLDIIVEGKDFNQVQSELKQTSRDHVELVIKEKLSDDLLNRHAPKKYFNMYSQISEKSSPAILESVVSPYPFKSSVYAKSVA